MKMKTVNLSSNEMATSTRAVEVTAQSAAQAKKDLKLAKTRAKAAKKALKQARKTSRKAAKRARKARRQLEKLQRQQAKVKKASLANKAMAKTKRKTNARPVVKPATPPKRAKGELQPMPVPSAA
jgi:hypothetical protein